MNLCSSLQLLLEIQTNLRLRPELTGLPGKKTECGCAGRAYNHVATPIPFIANIHSLINFRVLE